MTRTAKLEKKTLIFPIARSMHSKLEQLKERMREKRINRSKWDYIDR